MNAIYSTLNLWILYVLTQTLSAQQVTLKNPYGNILLIGHDNRIEIAVAGYKPQEIRVKFTGKGKISGDAGTYIVRLDSGVLQGDSCLIRVYDKKGIKILQQYRLYMALAPAPRASLCNLSYTVDSTDKNLVKYLVFGMALQKMDSLCLDTKGDTYHLLNGLFKISSYTLRLMPARGKMSVIEIARNRIGKDVKVAFSSLKPGDCVLIENIKVYNTKSKKIYMIHPFTFFIK
jgi:hypothetical protein